jgi:hypothetical protein
MSLPSAEILERMTDAPRVSRPAAIVGPGRHVRFAVVADDGRRSMAWAVWTNRRTLDAYLDVRPLSGRWKISLHQSGSGQSGLTKEWAETMAPDRPSRHFDLWQRPEEFAPGTRRSVQLVIPDTELRRWPAGVADDKPLAVRVTAPGVGHAACIEFHLHAVVAAGCCDRVRGAGRRRRRLGLS